MHDMTYAKQIITAINEKLTSLARDGRITAVNVSISPLSHVKPETLKETFAALVKNTPLEKILLNINTLRLGMKCTACNENFSINKPTFLCPECHSKNIAIIDSTEFKLDSIEVQKTPNLSK